MQRGRGLRSLIGPGIAQTGADIEESTSGMRSVDISTLVRNLLVRFRFLYAPYIRSFNHMAKNGERELFGIANALAVPNAMVYASMRNISAKGDLMATSEACIYEPLSEYLQDHDPTTESLEGPFMESFGLRDETHVEFDVSSATDELLITTAKSGDHPAFVELWTRHSKTAFNMAYRITGNRDDAEDVVQDAWMKAYTHLNTFDGRAKFSTWLTRIAINSALMILRRKRARPETSMEFTDGDSWQHWEIADQTKNVEELYARHEAAQRLKRAICRLQPALRSVVEIHQSNDSSVKETAELAGISVAATKSRLLRARKILHRALS